MLRRILVAALTAAAIVGAGAAITSGPAAAQDGHHAAKQSTGRTWV